MSSKSKSDITPTTPNTNTNTKSSPATPKVVTKISNRLPTKSDNATAASAAVDSPNPRPSIDHRSSPRTTLITPKPAFDNYRRSPKLSSTPPTPDHKQSPRVFKGSELQAQLTALQEDLRKAKEKLTLVEKEKAKAVNELKEAQKLSEEANEKLKEATVAQKRAEESSEIEKFRAVEMEQAGIEAAQKKEEGWQKELEDIRNQHAVDVSALLSSTQELQRLKQELAMTCDAKNQALSHAEDATKIAEIHVDKVEALSAELVCLRALLDSASDKGSDESDKLVSELKLQIESLKQDLAEAKAFEDELKLQKDSLYEKLEETKANEGNLKLQTETLNQLLEKALADEDELKLQTETLNHELKKANANGDELKLQIEILNQELDRAKANEDGLQLQIKTLNEELVKAKAYEEKLLEREADIEELNMELEAARMAESYAHSLMEEWKSRIEELDLQAEEAKRLERSASESLESIMTQLERSNDMLHDAESEMASLKEKVGLLEMTTGRQRGDLEESERSLGIMKEEASEMSKKVELLTSELETVKEEKIQALNNEKLAASSVQNLLEEKNKLISELESSRNEEEKSKKAMESLTSALHEVSSEAREAKEKLLSSQAEHENHGAEIDDLKHALEATKEKYENMLDISKHEIDMLMHSIEQAKHDYQESEAEWKEKENHLVNRVEKSEEENASLESEITRMVNLLKQAEEEASTTKEEEAQLKNTVNEAESEMVYLKEVLGEAKAESMKMKESLLDKENELQSIIQENEEFRIREEASRKKIEELSKLLEDAMAKGEANENGDISDSEKEYDMLPKVVKFSEQNGGGREENPKPELPPQNFEHPSKENPQVAKINFLQEELVQKDLGIEHLNGVKKEDEKLAKENHDSVEGEFKMWESCKIEDKDFLPVKEPGQEESFEEELDSKTEGGEGYDQINGLSSTEHPESGDTSPSKQLKKKKPLLRKFGNLLKKKSSSNQK